MATYYVKHKRSGKYFTGTIISVCLKRGWVYRPKLLSEPTILSGCFIKDVILRSVKLNERSWKSFKIQHYSVQKVRRMKYGKELDMHAEFFTELLNG